MVIAFAIKKILDSRRYETCTVEKIECTNHLLRNYCKKLRELSKSKGLPGTIKQVLHTNILYVISLYVIMYKNYMSDFRILGIEEKLMQAVRYLAGHSKSLLANVNTNVVEQFNSIIAQKLGGKRLTILKDEVIKVVVFPLLFPLI